MKGELTNIREAQKKMTGMADFMKLELQRDKDILEKAKTYIDALYRKKSRVCLSCQYILCNSNLLFSFIFFRLTN